MKKSSIVLFCFFLLVSVFGSSTVFADATTSAWINNPGSCTGYVHGQVTNFDTTSAPHAVSSTAYFEWWTNGTHVGSKSGNGSPDVTITTTSCTHVSSSSQNHSMRFWTSFTMTNGDNRSFNGTRYS